MCEAVLLQDFVCGGVVGVGLGLDAYDVVVEEEVVDDEGDCLGGEARAQLNK